MHCIRMASLCLFCIEQVAVEQSYVVAHAVVVAADSKPVIGWSQGVEGILAITDVILDVVDLNATIFHQFVAHLLVETISGQCAF